MNKPSWDDAPEWAQYLAQDEDGYWYWYEKEPYLEYGQWYVNDGEFQRVLEQLPIEKRPNTQSNPQEQ